MSILMNRNACIRRFLASFLLSAAIVSYTEAEQARFWMPIRNFLLTPNKNLSTLDHKYASLGVNLKASDSGYYLNPWQVASSVLGEAIISIDSNCNSLSNSQRSKLISISDLLLSKSSSRLSNELTSRIWPYSIPYTYGLKPGWISAPAQAEIALVLTSAYICSGKSTYMKSATEAMRVFDLPIEDGGVLADADGMSWFEEYAQPSIEPPRVLNGHIYTILALQKIRLYHPRATQLVNDGLISLKHNLYRYDKVTWSMYDLDGEPANNIYQQKLHIRQLGTLYDLTRDPFFSRYYHRFLWHLINPFSSLQRLALRPSRFLSFLVALNTVALFLTSVCFSPLFRLCPFRRNESL